MRAVGSGRAFCVTLGEQPGFLWFGSHKTTWLVNSPLRANLYARRSEAEKRAARGIWMGGVKRYDLNVVEVEIEWRVVG